MSNQSMGSIKHRLEQLIAHAIRLIYSEEYEFAEAVNEILSHYKVPLVEVHIALRAAASTKDGGSINIEESLASLTEINETADSEVSHLLLEICEANAKRDFLLIQMANEFLRIACEGEEQSFGGAVYKAEKLKNGPLTKEEREQLRLRYPLK